VVPAAEWRGDEFLQPDFFKISFYGLCLQANELASKAAFLFLHTMQKRLHAYFCDTANIDFFALIRCTKTMPKKAIKKPLTVYQTDYLMFLMLNGFTLIVLLLVGYFRPFIRRLCSLNCQGTVARNSV
jgi:hypothetical protein